MAKSFNNNETSASVNLTSKQFTDLMKEYAHLTESKFYKNYDANGNVRKNTFIGSDLNESNELLKKYGLLDDVENGFTEQHCVGSGCISEDDFLLYVEQTTGNNTFQYSKHAYVSASDEAVQTAIATGTDPIAHLKSNLRQQEEAWHARSGSKLEVVGKNRYKDDTHLYESIRGEQRRENLAKARQVVDALSQWDDKGYITLMYNLAVAYDHHRASKVREQFANRNDFDIPFTEDQSSRTAQSQQTTTQRQNYTRESDDAAFDSNLKDDGRRFRSGQGAEFRREDQAPDKYADVREAPKQSSTEVEPKSSTTEVAVSGKKPPATLDGMSDDTKRKVAETLRIAKNTDPMLIEDSQYGN